MSSAPPFVGPHEHKELELMQAGLKPMSMFIEALDSEFELFDEDRFDRLVQENVLQKHVMLEKPPGSSGPEMRRVFYTAPGEDWRVNAFGLVQSLYLEDAKAGWRPDLERIIGLLLGYSREDTESFLMWVDSQRTDKPKRA